MSVMLYPVEDRGMFVFCQADPRPAQVVDPFAAPADYPEGEYQILGRKSDDSTVYRAFRDVETCTRSGFDHVPFTIVPNWEHYQELIRR